jgi:hypothetical protein
MKDLKGMKDMKEIRSRQVDIQAAPAGQTENRNVMAFIHFMPFMHGGRRG